MFNKWVTTADLRQIGICVCIQTVQRFTRVSQSPVTEQKLQLHFRVRFVPRDRKQYDRRRNDERGSGAVPGRPRCE